MAEDEIPGWVDLHWECAAAMMEVGLMDEGGDWIANKDLRLGIEAYRERLQRRTKKTNFTIRVATGVGP